jgi:ElaB/YqjD/DUF883 family membrane-anchored ribosome-binding protein
MDEVFFDIIKNPTAWGFILILFMLGVFIIWITFRFNGKIITQNQNHFGMLIQLTNSVLSSVGHAVENNTEVLKQFIESNEELDEKFDKKLDIIDNDLHTRISELTEIIISEMNKLVDIISSTKDKNEQYLNDIRENIAQLEKSVADLKRQLYGESDNKDTNSA